MTSGKEAETKSEPVETPAVTEKEAAKTEDAAVAKAKEKPKTKKKTAAKPPAKTAKKSTAGTAKGKKKKEEEKKSEKFPEKKEKEDKPETFAEKKEEEKKDLWITFTLEVPNEEVEKDFNEALVKYAGEIKLPGFRKGKVPVEMIKSRYKEAVKDEVVNNVVEKALMEKIKKDKMKIISTPQVLNVDYRDGEDLKAEVRVEVFPTITLPDLESLEVEIPAAELEAEPYDEKKQIDAVLDANRRQVPVVSRAIKDDDYVMYKFQSKILQTKRMTPRKSAYFLVNEKEETEILDLYKEIVGKKAGDNLTVKRTYPGDYKKKPWAGNEIEHYIQIDSVFEWVKPDLDQAFLNKMGATDEESFKKKLKEEYEQYHSKQTEEKKMSYIIDRLIDLVDFPVPQSMVQQEMSRMLQQNRYPNINLKDDKEGKDFLESLKTDAEKMVRISFITGAVKENFEIDVLPEELEQEYKRIAERNNVPVKEVRKYYIKKENAENLKEFVLNEKVTNLLKEKVSVKIKK